MSLILANSSRIQEISGDIKFTVHGYIRKMMINIPEEIITIIILFYEPRDKWLNLYENKRIKFINKYTAECIEQRLVSCHGSRVISIGESFKWRIKLLKHQRNSNDYAPYIGVIKNVPEYLSNTITDPKYGSIGYLFCSGTKTRLRPSEKEYGVPFVKVDDILELTLNLRNFTICYAINGEDCGIAFDNIDKSDYRLLCTFAGKNNALQLI